MQVIVLLKNFLLKSNICIDKHTYQLIFKKEPHLSYQHPDQETLTSALPEFPLTFPSTN